MFAVTLAFVLTMLIFTCCLYSCNLFSDTDPENAPFFDDDSSVGQPDYGSAADTNDTVGQTMIINQPPPFAGPAYVAPDGPPPRYEDLYGTIEPPCNLNSAASSGTLEEIKSWWTLGWWTTNDLTIHAIKVRIYFYIRLLLCNRLLKLSASNSIEHNAWEKCFIIYSSALNI